MLNHLDPQLSELCYVDTDSAIFSMSFEKFEDNLLPEKKASWKEVNILANESLPTSQHGKMKLEGVFEGGHFKAIKIYRLYEDALKMGDGADPTASGITTRCKGISRFLATYLPSIAFYPDDTSAVFFSSSSLRPAPTGEIYLTQETKRLVNPFNFKRMTTADGLHTFPFSLHNCCNQFDQLYTDSKKFESLCNHCKKHVVSIKRLKQPHTE